MTHSYGGPTRLQKACIKLARVESVCSDSLTSVERAVSVPKQPLSPSSSAAVLDLVAAGRPKAGAPLLGRGHPRVEDLKWRSSKGPVSRCESRTGPEGSNIKATRMARRLPVQKRRVDCSRSPSLATANDVHDQVLNPPLATLEVAVLDADRLRRVSAHRGCRVGKTAAGTGSQRCSCINAGFHGRQRLQSDGESPD